MTDSEKQSLDKLGNLGALLGIHDVSTLADVAVEKDSDVCSRCGAASAPYCLPTDVQLRRPYCEDCYFKIQGW